MTAKVVGPWTWQGEEVAKRYGPGGVVVATVEWFGLMSQWKGWVNHARRGSISNSDATYLMNCLDAGLKDAGFQLLPAAEWLEHLRGTNDPMEWLENARDVLDPLATGAAEWIASVPRPEPEPPPQEVTPERVVAALRKSPSILLRVRSALQDLRVVGPWVSGGDGTFKRFDRNHYRDPPDGASRLAKWGNRVAWVFPPEPVLDLSSPPAQEQVEWAWFTTLSPQRPDYDEAEAHPRDEYVRTYSASCEAALLAADDMLRTDPRFVLMTHEDDDEG